LRPRLAFLADLWSDIAGSGRRRERQPSQSSSAARDEHLSAEEMKRRLEASRERLKQEKPPRD
jgi:hypothetical protein